MVGEGKAWLLCLVLKTTIFKKQNKTKKSSGNSFCTLNKHTVTNHTNDTMTSFHFSFSLQIKIFYQSKIDHFMLIVSHKCV